MKLRYPRRPKPVYVLYGVTERDDTECVLMFFDKESDLHDYVSILPGVYRRGTLSGVDYHALELDSAGPYGQPEQILRKI